MTNSDQLKLVLFGSSNFQIVIKSPIVKSFLILVYLIAGKALEVRQRGVRRMGNTPQGEAIEVNEADDALMAFRFPKMA